MDTTERADTVAGSQRRLLCRREWALFSIVKNLDGESARLNEWSSVRFENGQLMVQRCSALVSVTKPQTSHEETRDTH